MTLQEVVLAVLRDRYLQVPRNTMEALSRDIVAASLTHLHETGALSVPPEDLT
jgi:hypothetical protein